MGRRTGRGLALALVASTVSVLPLAAPAHGVSPCEASADNIYHWVGGQIDHDWMNPANWAHGQPVRHDEAPNDNKSLGDPWHPGQGGDTSDTIVCIELASGSDYVELDNDYTAYVWVQELHIDSSFSVHLKPENTGLLVMGSATSTLGAQTVIDAQGTFGGTATIETAGTVELKSNPSFPAHLSSQKIESDPTYTGPHGTLVVGPTGTLLFSQSGMALSDSYGVELHGLARLTGSYLAAGFGTSFDIASDGRFELANDGGYYEGFLAADTGQPTISQLHNEGVLAKTGGNGTSVIDAGYTEAGAGHVEVQTGAVALPEGNTHTAQVAATKTLSTGQCAPRAPSDPCVLTSDPAKDPEAVSFTVPASDADGSQVLVHENTAPLDFTAHADGLTASNTDPAVIELRFGASEADDQYGVTHIDDFGTQTELPGCPAVGLPAGVTNCVDRAASHGDGTNVYLYVRTRQTSRYVCHKIAVPEVPPPPPVAPPGTPPVLVPPTFVVGKPTWKTPTRAVPISVTVDHPGQVSISGKVKAPGLNLSLRAVSGSVAAATGTTFLLRFKQPLTAAQRTRLNNARKVKAVLTVEVVDTDGIAAAPQTATLTAGG